MAKSDMGDILLIAAIGVGAFLFYRYAIAPGVAASTPLPGAAPGGRMPINPAAQRLPNLYGPGGGAAGGGGPGRFGTGVGTPGTNFAGTGTGTGTMPFNIGTAGGGTLQVGGTPSTGTAGTGLRNLLQAA